MEIDYPSHSQSDGSTNIALIRAGLQPTGYQAQHPAGREMDDNTATIVNHLLESVPEFRRLADLRRKGWESQAGDTFFNAQRQKADRTDKKTSQPHFRLMQRIGNELHHATLGFATRTYPGHILDMCAAPGGFLKTAMKLNPDSEVTAFSLPSSDGGYEVLLTGDKTNCVNFLDITMLAADMGVVDIPEKHPDAGKFLPRSIEETKLFDLVLCDGHVLRTHGPARASYRETREPARLKTTQLALGLEHLKPRGTMVVLFHKVENWDTACFLRRFSRFSSVQLYKPAAGHATRSSFYMVATNVRSQDPEAILATEHWKAVWQAATFGTDEEFAEALRAGEGGAEALVDEFGSVLVEHGRKIWATQAIALEQAPFIKTN